MVVVIDDVNTDETNGPTRLRRAAYYTWNWRVRHSVFEVHVDSAQWAPLKSRREATTAQKVDSQR